MSFIYVHNFQHFLKLSHNIYLFCHIAAKVNLVDEQLRFHFYNLKQDKTYLKLLHINLFRGRDAQFLIVVPYQGAKLIGKRRINNEHHFITSDLVFTSM